MIPGITGMVGRTAKKPLEVSHGSVHTSGSNFQNFTFTNVTFGEEEPNRLIVIVAAGGKDVLTTVSSMSIGGISAEEASFAQTSTPDRQSSIWYAVVPTGITGVVTVNWSGPLLRTGIASYRIINQTSNDPVTSNGAFTNSGTSLSSNVSVVAGDVIISTCSSDTLGDVTMTGVTEQQDTLVESLKIASGYHIAIANETPRTITFNHSPANSLAATSAVWR